MSRTLSLLVGLAAIAGLAAPLWLATGASTAEADDHAWANYHWVRTANPFTLKLGANVSSAWDARLVETSNDWSVSSVLNTVIVTGKANPRTCKATVGQVEVCNATYGNNGWLGIASIWARGDHITQGTVKLNDTYFNKAPYNTMEWRNLVSCQEVGHTFGLDHQDEIFDNPNLGTCMDYTSSPGTNQEPNQDDYDMLESMYAHFDSTPTVLSKPSAAGASDNEPGDGPADWGRPVGVDGHGRANQFERDLGRGVKKITHVYWVR